MIVLRCKKHPQRKYLTTPKKGSCDACDDIWHLLEERRNLPLCWTFEFVLENGVIV